MIFKSFFAYVDTFLEILNSYGSHFRINSNNKNSLKGRLYQ